MTTENEKPLNANEINLASLANRNTNDGFLADLAHLARKGGGVGVALLVNGMIVAGELAPRNAIADELDAEVQSHLARAERPDDTDEAEWAHGVERAGSRFSTALRAQEEEEESLDAEVAQRGGPLDLNEVPAGVGRRAMAAEVVSHVTLRDAKIVSAAGHRGVTRVGVMRVALHHVAGWWLLRTDENGNSSFEFWTVEMAPPNSSRQAA